MQNGKRNFRIPDNENSQRRDNRDGYMPNERNAADIREKIRQLAKSYTPEWKFDEDNPDIGSVIAMIYAEQMESNLGRFHQVMDKYQIELVNMLGISLMAARPAKSIVVMNLLGDTVEGLTVSKGTGLLGEAKEDETQDTESVFFETVHDICVTGAKLTDIFQISKKIGKIQYLNPNMPISVFNFNHCGITENKLIIYHKNLFAVENETIMLRFRSAYKPENLNLRFANREEFRFYYYTEEGMTEFEKVENREDVILLEQKKKSTMVSIEGEPYTAIVLEALCPVLSPVEIKGIELWVSGGEAKPQFVCNPFMDMDCDRFTPFGEELALYTDCYIGNDRIFSKSGAIITLTFQLVMEEKHIGFPDRQTEDTLKVIKRKPKAVRYDRGADSFIQEISLEYYNGKGFKKLNCFQNVRSIFHRETGGSCQIQFLCPEDFEPFSVMGNEGLCIRMQIQKADNCYLYPCIHHYPVIKDWKMTYSYQEQYLLPDRLVRISGSRRDNLLKPWNRQENITVFSPVPYEGTGLYLGFDKKPETGPISLFFQLEENRDLTPLSVQFEYSASHEFKPLKVVDNTNRLTNSGTLIFMPPEDFSTYDIEGVRKYYIRIRDIGDIYADLECYHRVIKHIYINAVTVENVETLDEEMFYIDDVSAGMRYSLNARNILQCEVYVNEIHKYTPAQMKEMIADENQKVRAEYNALGEITDFYVLWSEVENFSHSTPEDRHYVIDRMNNTIEFGDGIHVKIPDYTTGTAFTVRTACCKGTGGNVDIGSINKTSSNLLLIGDIFNPIRAYGGNDIETAKQALKRGAAILSHRRRLVSEFDYIREVKAFSDNIDKVRCICGADGRINLVLLMKDFEEGSYSFRHICRELKSYLLQHCELTICRQDLYILEPFFLKVSVDVWITIEDMKEAFDIRNLFLEKIRGFFHPIRTEYGNGHEIGILPGEQQIITMLHSIKFNGKMEHYIVTAGYTDSKGTHEIDINRMKNNPFAVCMNGKHTVHMAEA